jgi:hypothetical protein
MYWKLENPMIPKDRSQAPLFLKGATVRTAPTRGPGNTKKC